MINTKTKNMIEGGKILQTILFELKKKIIVGTLGGVLENKAIDQIKKYKVVSAFKNYNGYPYNVCLSINDEVVHGFPVNKTIKDGDLVSVDFGIKYKSYYTDAAFSMIVGKGSEKDKKLVNAAFQALNNVIDMVTPNNSIGDLSAFIELVGRKDKLGIISELVGHSIGKELHELPQIPNFGKINSGPKIIQGKAYAIEPMFTGGSGRIKTLKDNWTVSTLDGSKAAHFETTVIADNDPIDVINIDKILHI